MNLKKIIFIFYIIFTVYILLLIGTTTMTFFKTTLAIMLMWANYIFFSIGFGLAKTKKINMSSSLSSNVKSPWLIKQKSVTLLSISVISLLSSIFAVEFYTGQSPINVLANLANGVSVYYEYQNYFSSEQLNIFSVNKIPFILMIFYVKLILFYSYVSLFKLNIKRIVFHYIYLFMITLAYIYIAIGRGTNFEYFELLILIVYLVFLKPKQKKKHTITINPIIISLILGVLGMYIFVEGVNARGGQFDLFRLDPDVNYDPNGWLSTIAPFLSSIVFRFYGYFGFGFFYVSSYLTDVWFVSIGNIISGILPMGYQLMGGESIQEIMESVVYVGVKWHPDFAVIVNNIGYIGLIIVCLLLGIISKYFSEIEAGKPVADLTNYILLLQMISLPVGNFLFTSSANQLILISLSMYWFWRLFINRRIRL